MALQNEKCIMVIDENLFLGMIANAAVIMGITHETINDFQNEHKNIWVRPKNNTLYLVFLHV